MENSSLEYTPITNDHLRIEQTSTNDPSLDLNLTKQTKITICEFSVRLENWRKRK